MFDELSVLLYLLQTKSICRDLLFIRFDILPGRKYRFVHWKNIEAGRN
jgi:hypothetical protein